MSTVTRDWELWSTSARLVLTGDAVTESTADDAADRAHEHLAEIDRACSRFRTDSELARAYPRLPYGVLVSPLLAELVREALAVAALTGGSVDPTLGHSLDAAGYDRDIRFVEEDDRPIRAIVSPRPGWRMVRLVGRELHVPAHLALDLGATAKAFAADRVAAELAEEFACGVLLALGGDISTAGATPADGWNVTVQDLPADPAARVRLTGGSGIATSSTQKRRWQRGGASRHHILDPRTGLPADPVWRSATVAASSCVRANAFSTAAIVRGPAAVSWLEALGVPARLVDQDGEVVHTAAWPAGSELGAEAIDGRAGARRGSRAA